MITHHPTSELLVDYAGGAMPEPLGLLMAAHLSVCGLCAAQSAELDEIGGAMLEALPAASLDDDALARTVARLDEPAPAAEPPPAEPDAETRSLLPRPLWPYVADGLSRLKWAWRAPALREAVLPVRAAGWRVSLLRLQPGGAVPAHTHVGTEYTLVLAGGLTNRRNGEHIETGDVDIADATCAHEQVADPGESCLCLAVLDAPVRFTGPLGRLANPLLRF